MYTVQLGNCIGEVKWHIVTNCQVYIKNKEVG